MPPVAAAVEAYVAKLTVASVLVNLAFSIGASLVLGALSKKPKAPSFGGFSGVARDRTVTIRESASTWKIRTGWGVIGGSISFIGTSGGSNEYFHFLITLAPHQVAWIGDPRFDGVRVPLDSNGDATGDYAGYVFVEKNLGTPDQAPFPDLLSKHTEWTIRHRQNGRAGVHIRLKQSDSKFPNGVPNITFMMAGAYVYDSRDAGAPITTSAAANGLDSGSLQAFAAATSDICTATAHGYATGGGPVRLTTTDTLPAGLSASTSYYTIRVDADTFKLATSVANAEAGTAVDITDTGTGTHKVGDYLPLALVTTSGAHGLSAGDRAYVRGHSDEVYGDHYVWGVPSSTEALLFLGYNVALSAGGTGGTITKMVFSDNPANWQATYLTNKSFGFGAVFDEEIDETDLEASANAADEEVSVTEVSNTFTADASTDELTQDSAAGVVLCMGDKITLSTTGTLPAGLSPGDYYAHPTDLYALKVATTRDNALANICIDVTDAGTGTHTVTRTAEPRYTVNGTADVAEEPHQLIGYVNSAMAGRVPYIGGKFHILSGYYRTPTVTFDEGDLRQGAFDVLGLVGAQEAFNAVKGVYLSPANAWQPADFPAVTNSTYEAQDGGRVWRDDFDLVYTVSGTMAQRLASIELNKARQEITVPKAAYKLSACTVKACDVVNLTMDHLGWSAKPFEVVESVWTLQQDEFGAPYLGMDLSFRETASAVWDWSTASETTIDPAPNTNLPSISTVAAPTGLSVASGTAYLFTALDGTVHSRMYLSWTAPADIYATQIEVQWKRAVDSEYESRLVPADTTEYYASPVEDGVAYSPRIRTIGALPNIKSDWLLPSPMAHTVIGKTELPSTVGTLAGSQNGNVAVFTWSEVTDADLLEYELRYMPSSQTYSYADASFLKAGKGVTSTTASLPPGSWTVGIEAKDTSGNYSSSAPTVNIVMKQVNTTVDSVSLPPWWKAALTDCIVHQVSNTVFPKGTQAVDQYSSFAEVEAAFIPDPVANAYIEAPELDGGFDSDDMRFFATIESALCPGQTGLASPSLEVDHKTAAGAYDGFEEWAIGVLPECRYVKSRVHIQTGNGIYFVSAFTPTLDEEIDVQTGTEAIAVSGTTVTFPVRYHTTPVVSASVTGATPLIVMVDSVTTTGFDATVYNLSGTDVGGVINYIARGV